MMVHGSKPWHCQAYSIQIVLTSLFSKKDNKGIAAKQKIKEWKVFKYWGGK